MPLTLFNASSESDSSGKKFIFSFPTFLTDHGNKNFEKMNYEAKNYLDELNFISFNANYVLK